MPDSVHHMAPHHNRPSKRRRLPHASVIEDETAMSPKFLVKLHAALWDYQNNSCRREHARRDSLDCGAEADNKLIRRISQSIRALWHVIMKISSNVSLYQKFINSEEKEEIILTTMQLLANSVRRTTLNTTKDQQNHDCARDSSTVQPLSTTRLRRNEHSILTVVSDIMTFCRNRNASTGAQSDETQRVERGDKDVVCQHHYEWIECMTFMISYDVLSPLLIVNDETRPKGPIKYEGAERKAVINKSLEIIRELCPNALSNANIVQLNDVKEILAQAPGSIVEQCFPQQVFHIRRYLHYEHQSINRALVYEEWKTRCDIEHSIDNFSDISSDEEELDNSSQTHQTTIPQKSTALTHASHNDSSLGAGISKSQLQLDTKSSESKDVTPSSSALDEEGLTVHIFLSQMVIGAVTTLEVQTVSEQVVSLIQRAGVNGGADGVLRMGQIISYGGGSAHGKTVLTDLIVAQVLKACVKDSTSALRVTALIQSMVFPVVMQTLTKDKPAARLLVSSILTSLAKNRPIECVDSLLIPCLLKKFDDKDDERVAQCELVARIVKTKQGSLPLTAIGRLISGLVLVDNKELQLSWNDHSMVVLTSCLNLRPLLEDDVIRELTHQLHMHSITLCKSMKFSAVCLALVSKYGVQLQTCECIESLRQAATQIKTFMGKTVLTSLKRLSK